METTAADARRECPSPGVASVDVVITPSRDPEVVARLRDILLPPELPAGSESDFAPV